MTKQISILEQGSFDWWTTTEHGIEFKPDTPREDWLKAVDQLTAMHESSGKLHFRSICCLADALNFGEANFNEEFSQALSDTRAWMKISAKTIANAMWVMKQIPSSRRRELLSLSHHEAIAALEPAEQDELLALSEAESLTVAELRKLVAERHPKTKRGKERKTKPVTTMSISNAAEAKTAAVELSNWLTENEGKIGKPLLDVLGHISKIFRRITDKGRKR